MADEKPKDKSPDQEILATARERFKLAAEAESDLRKDALDDLEFRSGRQWPDAVKVERELDARPCLTINRIPQFVRQITNDQRQNRPAIKVHPVDDQADIETAKIFQGLVRHIEYNSHADTAYDTAFDGAVSGGFGYWRVVTDYIDPMAFEQEILIKRIRDHMSVYRDPGASEPDGSDMNWCFITEDLLPDDFKSLYPKSELSSMDDFASIGDNAPDWMPGGKVRIAEYFYKDFKDIEICQLSNGVVVPSQHLPEKLPEGVTISQKRTSKMPTIKWCKINAVEILEERDWVGKWIPVVPVYGEELYVDGKLILEGLIRHAKDSQRMLNYWASLETETIALAPRTPWVGAEGQFEGHEGQWKQANRKNLAFLQYKPTSIAGIAVPPPQRQVFEAPVQAITQARMQAAEDIKATTGIYDSSLGAKSNETSGVAIQRRNNQAQTSNFHFTDNLTRSLRHTGRILVDLIPKIYDTPRAARIIGEDGQQEIVLLNQVFNEGQKSKAFNLGAGKYDVEIEVGPSYATKRQEAVSAMLDLTKSYPQVAQVAGDLMVKSMDWPGADAVAERLKKTLPPGIADDDKDAPPIPPQVKQQLDQSHQMIDQLTKALNAAHDKIDTKQVELESRERIAMAQIQAEIEIQMAKMGSAESMALLKAEIAGIENRLKMLGIDQPIQTDSDNFGGQNPQGQQPQGMQPQGQPPPQTMPTGGLSPGNTMGQT